MKPNQRIQELAYTIYDILDIIEDSENAEVHKNEDVCVYL